MKMKKHKKPRLLPYHIILAAKQGDPDAMNAVYQHFDRYINFYSLRRRYDRHGNLRVVFNQDVKDRIIRKLTETLIYKYDPTKLPEGETLTQ